MKIIVMELARKIDLVLGSSLISRNKRRYLAVVAIGVSIRMTKKKVSAN
jgi:hypothetical protein